MDPTRGTEPSAVESDEVLRAKYFDYCSAQVADLVLLLSPDEVYALAEEARRRTGADQRSFTDLVWMATEGVRDRLVLPPFEIWVEDYREHPERYEKYFLLWETDLPPASGV